MESNAPLEAQLNALTPAERLKALQQLIAAERAANAGEAKRLYGVNLHCHTIYSYNGYGYSPSALAWLAHREGWYALGTVDFDVLDAVEETLTACRLVSIRGCAGLETRAFYREGAKIEFNSPGEPGIVYYLGVGFTSSQPPPSARATLEEMRTRAAERNREMVARINAHLAPVEIDYARDVLPLTPSGNATERHILIAYDMAARRLFPKRADLVAFWAKKLEMPREAVEQFLGDVPFPHDAIRSRLMKRGGVGYAQPEEGTFPPLEVVQGAILACGAIPSYPFLDGTSLGEERLADLLERLIPLGMGALTAIPDRNWNIPNPTERERKVAKWHEMMALARAFDLPVLVGTEMNRYGQRLLDDFTAEALRPYYDDFLRAADWIYGHTVLQAAWGIGFTSAWARDFLPNRSERNAFYTRVGKCVSPDIDIARHIPPQTLEGGPKEILRALDKMS